MALPGSSSAPAVDRRRDDAAYRSGQAVVGLLEVGHPAAPDHDQGGVRERHRRGHGPRRLDQRRAPPAGHRPRGPGRARARRLQPDRRPGAPHRRHQAARPLPHDRRRPGRRRPGRDARAARRRPAPRRLPDRDRAHRWPRTWPHSTRPRPTATSSTPWPTRSTPRAASPSCGVARPSAARWSRWPGIDAAHASTATARVFDGEDLAMEAILAGTIEPGTVVVIRYEGPKGGPGHAGDAGGDRGHEGRRPGRRLRAGHRRPVLRRDPRLLHRPRGPRGGRRRPDRPRRRRRPHRDRRRPPAPSTCVVDAASSSAAGPARSTPTRATPRACWPSTPGWSPGPSAAPSPSPDPDGWPLAPESAVDQGQALGQHEVLVPGRENVAQCRTMRMSPVHPTIILVLVS